MKKLLYLFVFVSLLSGCNLISKPGNLEITVSYFYNNFQGYKPDVGSKAYLFKSDVTQRICMDSLTMIYTSLGYFFDKNGKYIKDEDKQIADADVSGKINFNDLPSGKYFLVLSSKGRNMFSKKDIVIESGKKLLLVKNFEARHDGENYADSWN